jgi:hypothetical protein
MAARLQSVHPHLRILQRQVAVKRRKIAVKLAKLVTNCADVIGTAVTLFGTYAPPQFLKAPDQLLAFVRRLLFSLLAPCDIRGQTLEAYDAPGHVSRDISPALGGDVGSRQVAVAYGEQFAKAR